MLKVMLVSAAAAAIVGLAGLSSAATATPTSPNVIVKKNRIAANGRCNGISYGTGARSCGTKTGGPVGGLSSRN